MAKNKNAMLRYQVLDRCFRNPGKKFFWQDLLEECNKALYEFNGEESQIQKRQLLDDIKFMESDQGWAVVLKRSRENKRIYFQYADLDFSINNQPLNEAEINQLQSALLILNKFKGLPQFEWMEELLPRLQKGVEPDQINPIFHLEENPFLKGKELIGELFNNILYQKVLKIEYKDFKSAESYLLVLHPSILKEYNNRWFLFGYNPKMQKENWNLAVDRIVSIEVLEDQKYLKSSIDWDEYFEDLIGVTKHDDAILTKIQLWFHPATAPYILSKPIHGSQKIKLNEKSGLNIEIQVFPNYEFFQQLLFYGNKIKVISPEHIREKIISMLSNTLDNYLI
jgi:predicted DNA-binding transcriptional regulator YafY